MSPPDNGSTGGSSVTGQGGSNAGSGAHMVSTGGSSESSTGGSTGQATGGTPGQATGGTGMTGSTGGTGISTATGGSTGGSGTGGSSATGGSSMIGTGGAATGGRSGSGGTGAVPVPGGHAGSGGTPATGGRSGGTGGATATGGAPGTGGVVATGGSGTGGTTATGGAPGGGGGTITSTTAGGTIVPLYTDPSDSSWNAIATAALAHPTVDVVAIVNPADGPGSSKRSDYTSGIAALQAAHIKVIGYIATGYGANSISSMESQMDSWKSFYPAIQGIFFDEQSNSASDVSHYQTLSQYAKSKGMSYTVGNPGTDVPTSYIGVLDTMLVYETDGLPTISSLQKWGAYAPTNFGIIPYKVPSMNATFVKQAKQYTHYVYLTNDDLPNPWDSLTSYFSDLLAGLE